MRNKIVNCFVFYNVLCYEYIGWKNLLFDFWNVYYLVSRYVLEIYRIILIV